VRLVAPGSQSARVENLPMKSPFPGMDPYIEACGLWEDFHSHLIEQIAERLADVAPERYLVRTGERSYVVMLEGQGTTHRPILPDVGVTVRTSGKKPGRKSGGTAVADAPGDFAPITMRAFVEEAHREAFVEIREAAPKQRLVTCIEVLSPTNKRPGSAGWELYQRKRQSLLLGGVHLLEIDLLRGGQRMPMLDPWPTTPYTVLLARAHKPDACRVWPISMQHRLPPIAVPLAKPDADLALDLQSMVDSIYRRYRYASSIDYGKPLTPSLGPKEATWFQKRLRSRHDAV
jgi:hypothetical protein